MSIMSDMNAKGTKRGCVGMAVALLCLAATQGAFADVLSWTAGDGAWENGGNWSSGTAPSATDFADIQHTGAISSTAANNVALEVLNKSALSVTAGKLAVDGTIDTIGALAVSGGAKIDAGRITVGTTGGLDVDGVGTAVNVVEGVFNYGTWHMAGGGRVDAESFDNFQHLVIEGGARATANSMINHFSMTGTLTVRDTASALVIKGNLTNLLRISVQNHGQIETHGIDNASVIDVGGGSVVTNSLINSVSSHGQLLVHGSASHFTASDVVTNGGDIHISAGAADIANLVNGGSTVVDFDGALAGEDLSNTGTVALTKGGSAQLRGRVLNSDSIEIDGGSSLRALSFQQTAGETSIAGGVLGASGPLGVDIAGGELRGHGTVDGKLLISNVGVVTPGGPNSVGHFDVKAGLDMLGGTFAVNLAGTDPDHYDLLNVTGHATLGGTLSVSLIDGFDPILGNFFDIILADSIDGAFGTLMLPTLSDGLFFKAINGGTFFRLQVAAVPLPVPALLLGGALGVLAMAKRRRAPTEEGVPHGGNSNTYSSLPPLG